MAKLLLANLKMIVRDRQALFWALAFPLVFVVIFGLFDLDRPATTDLAVVGPSDSRLAQTLVEQLRTFSFFRLNTSFADEAAARQALEAGDVDVVLILPPDLDAQLGGGSGASGPPPFRLLQDEANTQRNQIVRSALEQVIQRFNLELVRAPTVLSLEVQGLRTRRLTFFDFLLPGLIGMGVMNYAVIGMASVVSLYREQKIFKRLLVTPLPVRTFFAAQITAYLVLSLVQAGVILAAGVLVFKAHVYGSILWMFLLVAVANIVFLNLGFLVGAFSQTVAAASGLGNAVTLPMMFFSGTFFPTESLPAAMGQVVRFLPLTPLLEMMRGVMLDAQPLWHYPGQLALLLGWIAVSSLLAVRTFRFG